MLSNIILIISILMFGWFSFKFGIWTMIRAVTFDPVFHKSINRIMVPTLLDFYRWVIVNEKFDSSNLEEVVREYIKFKTTERMT